MVATRVLFVSGVWMPASGGSEISFHTLAVEMLRRGHPVRVLTGISVGGLLGEDVVDGIPVRRVAEADLKQALLEEFARFRPATVAAQLMWAEEVLVWSNDVGIPAVYFLRSEGPTLNLRADSDLAPAALVANSPTTRDYARQHWNRDALVVLPLVRLSDYELSGGASGMDRVTMFNPVAEKGGHLFRELAMRSPKRRFLAVEGWHHWKKPDGTWDLDRLASAARSYGGTTPRPPHAVPLDDLPNVEWIPASSDVRPVYARTRVLVVPSAWAEPFGRVILEAMVNGIPVLYSGAGSSNLAAGSAGVRVRDPDRVESWIEALSTLDNPEAYAAASAASRQRAVEYEMAAEVDRVVALLAHVATGGSR